MDLTANVLKEFFREVFRMVEEEKDYFCELDRKLGDGDHGVTLSIGWQAVYEKLNGELKDEQDCGKIALVVGKTFLSAVGSSVGPLYATGLMRGGKVVKGKSELNDLDLKEFWIAFASGVKERGQANVGDKTMVDTLAPFAEKLEEEYEQTNAFLPAFKEALIAAEEGMKSTKDIVSKIGRSSRLGDRSIGVQDPGATSIYYILLTFLQCAEENAEKAL